MRLDWKKIKSDDGAQFLEYALLAGLIAIAVGVGVGAYGKELLALFNKMSEAIRNIIDQIII